MITQFIYAHMTIYRKLIQNITRPKKCQKGSKIGQKMVKIKNAIEIPFMRAFFYAIFIMITQFIYAHMTIYRKLIQNITKGQKRVKKCQKGSKIGQKMVKIKNALEIPFMSAILFT